MTNKEQINRLKVLIEELEIIYKGPRKKSSINMSEWCELDKFHSMAALTRAIKIATEDPCGTSACLAGKAGLIPRIRKMGFKWDFDHSQPVGFEWERKTQAVAGFVFKERGHLPRKGDIAVKEFFGERAFQDVFHNFNIKTLFQGIRELKAFVKVEQRIYDQFSSYLDD